MKLKAQERARKRLIKLQALQGELLGSSPPQGETAQDDFNMGMDDLNREIMELEGIAFR